MTTDARPSQPHKWLILAVILTAEIMDLLDSTVVNVAGPSLRKDLGATDSELQWVIGGYALTLGAGLILGGRLGDRFGRRRLFLIGLIGFTAASLLCALAPNIGVLIALRLIQGAAGAMLLPQTFGLLVGAFNPSDIGKAYSVFGPVFGLSSVLGPIIGGALIQANLFDTGWRLIFVVNIPIGIAALVIAWRLVPHVPGDHAIKIDLVGAAIIAVSAGLLIFPLVEGLPLNWPAWTFISLAASLVGFFLFTVQQRISARRGGTPLVMPSIFRKSSYTTGLAGIALFFTGMIGVNLIVTLFLQIGEGFNAGQAGVSNIPLALGGAIGGAISGAVLSNKLGRAVLQIGAAIELVGAVVLWLSLSSTTNFTIWQLVPGMLLTGFGTGLLIAALFNVILGSVDDAEVGSASGVLSAVQSIFGAAGVAVFGTIFFAAVDLGHPADGFRNALLVQFALLAVFLLLSPFFPRRARPESSPEPIEEDADQATS
jgi:EmrB/QacA subfamily drug resistance transporter